MAYTIAYTDEANKGTITIEDVTINQDTSLKIPGRNVTGFGSAIAENFLHLLENFASATEPARPVEGQLWYDATPGVEQLKVYDGTNWVASGGLKKATAEPDATQSLIGDLWVDTDNQQLYLYSGSGWVLVGPNFSEGLNTGANPVSITGTDNQTYNAIQVEVDAKPVGLFAYQEFTPKVVIPGFTTIKPGFNLSSNDIAGDGTAKFVGTSEKAESLIVSGDTVAAGNFLRSDVVSTTQFPLNVQNNLGVNYGINSELNIGVEGSAGIIQHNIEGSSIDVRVKSTASGTSAITTLMRFDSNLRVGINNVAPDEALDVTGNILNSGTIRTNNTTESTTISDGSIVAKGGVGIAKNLNVGGTTTLNNLITTQNITPDINNLRTIGASTNKYATIHATTFIGNLTGNVSGTVSGRAGSADKLTSATTFKVTGDISAPDIVFDGQTGGGTKTFATTISNEIVAGKDPVLESQANDEILINRVTGETGLKKITRSNLLSAVPVNPPGVILPYGGVAAPAGWLLCHGQQVRIADYNSLFDAIGYNFKASSLVTAGFFALPDLRGRMPLGKDDMGGTSANNVTLASADVLGSKDGNEDVTIQVENLPEHEHDLRGDSGDQYYALRDVSGTPNDNEAIIYDAPTGTGAGQAYPASGGILTDESLGTAMNVMNPFITLNYIIYTGRTA